MIEKDESYPVSLEQLLGITFGNGFDAPQGLNSLVMGAHLGDLEILQVLLMVLLRERLQCMDVG